METCDVAIIGAGHNGLVCAAYLAKAGLDVRVYERRGIVGGAAVTEEFAPGFRNSTASYTVSLLAPQVIADLELHRHGLRIIERRIQNFMPLPDGRHLIAAPGRTRNSVAQFSTKDAANFDAFSAELERVADALRNEILRAPPNLVDGPLRRVGAEALRALGFGARLRALNHTDRIALFELFTKSAGDLLDSWFESDPVKALFGFDAIVGNYASPYTPSSAYVLLHHAFGEVNGRKGLWGHAVGGMGAITQAMASAARERGVKISCASTVKEVLVDKGCATGIVLDNGSIVRARMVASNLNPNLLFTKLVREDALPREFLRRMKGWKSGSGTLRMNLALSRLPDFTALPGNGDHLTSGIIIAPSLSYMERAYLDAKTHGWSRDPVVEMLIPSTLDDSLAPAGQHVASLFCQHVAPILPNGATWDDHRDEVADLMIATVDKYAPGFAASVIARQINTPLDLERTFGLTGGDIFHGALTMDQLFSARPAIGYADYRSPIQGLYMCGAGTHPGGGVTGAPGANAARAIVTDMRARR
jgi:phytoene dehydrogenase-like protein